MPANVVKTPAQEKMWDKAKSIVKENYNIKSEDDMKKKNWAMVNAIFQDMKNKKGS